MIDCQVELLRERGRYLLDRYAQESAIDATFRDQLLDYRLRRVDRDRESDALGVTAYDRCRDSHYVSVRVYQRAT